MKKCTQCEKAKRKTEFYQNPNSPDGYRSFCKQCDSEKYKLWYEKNRTRKLLKYTENKNDPITHEKMKRNYRKAWANKAKKGLVVKGKYVALSKDENI